MKDTFFDVQGIGRVKLIQECGANLIVEDESGTRLSLPASRCTVDDQTAAALADQFTGEAMGEQVAAVEGFNPSPDYFNPDAELRYQNWLSIRGFTDSDEHRILWTELGADAADPAAGEG